jgi:hypothetical protein
MGERASVLLWRYGSVPPSNEDTLASMGSDCDHSGAFDEREMNAECCGLDATTGLNAAEGKRPLAIVAFRGYE